MMAGKNQQDKKSSTKTLPSIILVGTAIILIENVLCRLTSSTSHQSTLFAVCSALLSVMILIPFSFLVLNKIKTNAESLKGVRTTIIDSTTIALFVALATAVVIAIQCAGVEFAIDAVSASCSDLDDVEETALLASMGFIFSIVVIGTENDSNCRGDCL